MVFIFIILVVDVGTALGDAGDIGTSMSSSMAIFSLRRARLGLAGRGLSSRGSLGVSGLGWRSRSCLRDFLREVVVLLVPVLVGRGNAPLDLPPLAEVGVVRSRRL